jgi:4'-phosphopantetheinyl transferase
MCAETTWRTPPAKSVLASDEVHVWRSTLDFDLPSLAHWRSTLSADELTRADRFHSSILRDRFIAGRGILRDLLSRYLGTPARDIQFCTNVHGKPALTPGSGWADVRFNLSHSHGLALFAFILGSEVGVDLESLRSSVRNIDLAERFFSAREIEALRALPPDSQHEMFFHCWTRKEAYIKARGVGLTLGLSSFAVSLDFNLNEYLPIFSLEDSDARRWRLRQVDPGGGFVGAVVAEGADWPLKLWEHEKFSQ